MCISITLKWHKDRNGMSIDSIIKEYNNIEKRKDIARQGIKDTYYMFENIHVYLFIYFLYYI